MANFEEGDFSFPRFFSQDRSEMKNQPRRAKRMLKGAGGSDAADADMSADYPDPNRAPKGSGGKGGGKGGGAQKAENQAGKGKEGGKGKGKGKGKRRRGKGKKGKGGEGDYDYMGEDDNTSLPMKIIDRMQDMNVIGGQFIGSIGRSIEETSPNAVVDNVSLMDLPDGVVLTVFLVIFLTLFGFLNMYVQKIAMYFLRKWILRMDPYEAFESKPPDCSDASVPIFHKVLFFPDQDDRFAATVGESPKNVDVKKSQVYRILQKSLLKAKSNISGCLFVFTCRELAELLVWARQELKLGVSIVTDEEMARLPTSLIGMLADAGVSIKVMRSNVLLHHHFIVIDGRLLFNGSFNWTKQAVGFNFETMMITNDPKIVLPYSYHFTKLNSKSISWNYQPEEEFVPFVGERPICADYLPNLTSVS
ncbi:unnamed protein product [Notodromas monacha]|uniref:Mitochondrial cardiolipin hydrolase n=1 Tax=Notodromas monacha TaxID=399045 RepID=A0A7R9BQH9_9CRUS|nr:unnamed protein product [Notodromas monacha]CAG0918722.1 unnamed protein product [Notodromas monacha]